MFTLGCSVCYWAHCARPVMLEKVPAVGVVGNWGFSLQAWLCGRADIPRESLSMPCLLCCREWSGR